MSDHPTPAPRAPEAERPTGTGANIYIQEIEYLTVRAHTADERARAAEEELERVRGEANLEAELKEYRNVFFSAKTSWHDGYTCGISDAHIASLGRKPPGEEERWKNFERGLKSWEPKSTGGAAHPTQGEPKGEGT